MDQERFDQLARGLAAGATRRGMVRNLTGAAIGGVLAAVGAGEAGARKKAKQRGQRRGKNRQTKARAEAASCCASGACAPGKGKNLGKCCYKNQNLTGKNFSGANLGSANFSGATLTGANLQGANAGKACFVGADLRGLRTNGSTNLAGAIYCRTQTDSGENNTGCGQGTPCCPTCASSDQCGDDEICCAGRCIAGDCCANGEQSTCGDDSICCNNTCVEGECCQAAQCPNETCQRRSCRDHQCAYEPVFGVAGPRCQTVCCQDEQGEPVCCDAGTTTCGNGACATDDRTVSLSFDTFDQFHTHCWVTVHVTGFAEGSYAGFVGHNEFTVDVDADGNGSWTSRTINTIWGVGGAIEATVDGVSSGPVDLIC